MYSLRDIEKRLDQIDKKIAAIENNAHIYKLSRQITETQQRFANNKKDQEAQKAYLAALASVHQHNLKDLENINDIAHTARAELVSLNQALELLNNISITHTSKRIYAMQLKLTKLWPLNQRDNRGKCICPITGKVMEADPILLTNGCQYSKEGLERAVEDEKYFPRYLPGSALSLTRLDKQEIIDKLSIASTALWRAASIFMTTSLLVGMASACLGVILLGASIFFPPLFPAAITLLALSVGISVGVGPVLGMLSAGIGFLIGKMIDVASIPTEFAPPIKSTGLSTVANLHQVMDIKPGQQKKISQEKTEVSEVHYEPVNTTENLVPQYTASNKLV